MQPNFQTLLLDDLFNMYMMNGFCVFMGSVKMDGLFHAWGIAVKS